MQALHKAAFPVIEQGKKAMDAFKKSYTKIKN